MKIKEYIKSKTTKELKAELDGLNDAIDKFECFSTKDLRMRELIEVELEERGFWRIPPQRR